jgi:peroxiredoxin
VKADTLGNFAVEGSEESLKLAAVEKDHAAAYGRLAAIASKLEKASDAEEVAALNRQISKEYVDYYRNCVKYVLANSKSLTSVPVLYQNFGAELPVFAQNTDAIHFMNVSDSLAAVYPESRYVRALKKEAERRFGYLELEARLQDAQEVGFPDIVLPDINAQKIKLSEVDSKVIMVYFWTVNDAAQKMFNLDFLKSVYEDYHKKGLEIYQVSLDVDKAAWARVVKEQKLPWINVCDSRGSASPYVLTYNVGSLPAVYVISDGELVDGEMSTEKSFRRRLEQLLK